MKKLLLFILMLLPMVASAEIAEISGNEKDGNLVSSNADLMESLYGEWILVGWYNEGTWYEVNPKYVGRRNLSIEIPREDYVIAYSIVNRLVVGLLTLNGNEMIFGGERRRFSTLVGCSIMENEFFERHILDINYYQLDGKLLRLYYTDKDYFVFTSDFKDEEETTDGYRPFIEEGKVWKLGGRDSGNPVQFVEYYYFDGDTIIADKTLKRMMCQQYVSPDYPDYDNITQYPSLRYVGAWYEVKREKTVYFFGAEDQYMTIKYNFSLDAYDALKIENNQRYVIGPEQTGGLEGFKGVYRDAWCDEGGPYYNTIWMEGVGSIDGPFYGEEYHSMFLMSCVVGDEVIYLNDEYEDGATPEGARKSRFDFTHTIKIKPKAPIKREKSDACISSSEREVARPKVKAPMKKEKSDAPRRNEADQSVYGEYNDLQLGINLNPLDEAYQVRITNESGQVVYEKTVNAGSIVALSIDISAYPKGRYTVTVENSNEAFTGEFETQTSGISDAARLNDNEKMIKHIYNLQGQRLQGKPSNGLYIQDGKKYLVK